MSKEINPKSNRWILIVEDELDLKELVAEEVTRAGYGVHAAASVFDALRLLGNQKFHCVLLDMKLEKGSGTQVLAAMRRENQNLNFATPVIVISGILDVDIIRQIKGTVYSIFVKPFDITELVAKIDALGDGY